MCQRSSIAELACYWRVCQHNRRQQIATGLWWTHLSIETKSHRSANHHFQSCKFIKRLKELKPSFFSQLLRILIFVSIFSSKPIKIWMTLVCETYDRQHAVSWENQNHKNAAITTVLSTTRLHLPLFQFVLQLLQLQNFSEAIQF